jgi:hypothetical protein
MHRYSEAVKADAKRRMSPPQRKGVAKISAELRINVVNLYNSRKAWQLQGEVTTAKRWKLRARLLTTNSGWEWRALA